MQIKITQNYKDYIQFIKELRKDKKQFNSLFLLNIKFYCFFASIIYLMIDVFFSFGTFYYPTLQEFIIINFAVIGLYFLLLYKSNLIFFTFNIIPITMDFSINDNKYIEFKSALGFKIIKYTGIKCFYETETFYAIPLWDTEFYKTLLIKKENSNFYLKNVLVNMTDIYTEIEKNKNKKKNILYYFEKYALTFLTLLLFTYATSIFTHYPLEKENHNQIYVSKMNLLFIYNDSKYWELGLRPYDIPLSINDIHVTHLEPSELEERLKGKNIKLKVLKRETGEIKEYQINTQ